MPALGTGGLVCVAAVLAVFAVGQGANRTELPSSVAVHVSAPQVMTKSAPAQEIPQRPASFFQPITDRPLFAPTRTPGETEQNIAASRAAPKAEEPARAPKLLPRPAVKLHGISGENGEYKALLSVEGRDPEWISVYSDIGQWKISEIGTEWIVFEHDEQTHRVELYQ